MGLVHYWWGNTLKIWSLKRYIEIVNLWFEQRIYIYYIEKPNSALFCSATGINLHCTYVARCLPVCKYHAHNKNNSGNINFRFGVEVDLLHRMERTVNQSLCHTPWINCSCLNPNVSTCFPPPRCCCYYRLAHRLLLFPTPPPHLFIVINISTIPKYTLFIYLSFHQMVGPPFFMAPSRSRPL